MAVDILIPERDQMNREEAIEWLYARGVKASKRDWALGESIYLLVGPPRESGGITYYENAFYLYPGPEGSWIFLKCKGSSSYASYPDLESALQAAWDALRHECPPEI